MIFRDLPNSAQGEDCPNFNNGGAANQNKAQEVRYKVSVSNIKLDKKPDKSTTEGRKKMAELDRSFYSAELTIEEILQKVLGGYSISNIVWEGSERVSENFKQFQIFILDFDNDLFFKKGIGPNVNPEIFVERLRNRGLDCSYILTSLSDSPERRKFRVLFFSDEICSNPAKANALFKGLVKEFDGDATTTGLAQYFFPCKEVVYSNSNYCLSRKDGSLDNFEFELLKGKDKKTVALFNKEAVDDDFFDDLSNIYKGKASKIDSKYKRRKIQIKEKERNQLLVHFRFNSFIINDFYLEKLKYGQLKALATNLFPFEGTKDFIINRMMEHDQTSENPYNSDDYRLVDDIYRVGYRPIDLKVHFGEEHDNYLKIFELPRNLKAIPRIPREEAHTRLEEEIAKFFDNPKPNFIKVVRAETGLGKTTCLINHIKNLDCLVGFPNHLLINEKCKILDEKGIKYHSTKGLPTDINQSIYDLIMSCYDAGDPKLAIKTIRRVIKDNPTEDFSYRLKEFLEDNKKALESEGITLTTHARLLYSNTSKPIIVSDEDLLNQLFQTGEIEYGDCLRLKELINTKFEKDVTDRSERRQQKLNNQSEEVLGDDPAPYSLEEIKGLVSNVVDAIERQLFSLNNSNGRVIRNELKSLEDYVLEEVRLFISSHYKEFKNPIVKFLSSDFCVRHGKNLEKIQFIEFVVHQLNPLKSYLVLSATANERIYRLLERYGFEVEFVEIPNAIHGATIYQDLSYSNSKSSLFKRENIELYRKEVDALNAKVITHKESRKDFKNYHETIYFGQCSGFNDLEGKDVVVLGAKHLAPHSLALYTCYLDESLVSQEIPKPEMMEIESRAGRFRYNSFENEGIRLFQQAFIEDSLEQAIGRTRYLWKDVKIYLLSNYLITEKFEQITLKDNYKEVMGTKPSSDTDSETDEEE